MQSLFSQTFFIQNRRKLREQIASDAAVVLSANGLLQRTNDTTFPFRQHSDFWYLTGIDEPDIVLCMTGTEEFLIVPSRSATRIYFDGAVDHGALTERAGIAMIVDEREGWSKLQSVIRNKAVLTHRKSTLYDSVHGSFLNPAQQRVSSRVQRIARHKLQDISPYMAALRVIKQPQELRALDTAVTITHQTLNEIRQATTLAAFTTEYEVEAAITASFRKRGAEGHGYAPIIAGGRRATTLHYVANKADLHPDELIVIDVGAEVEQYSADVTRTLSQKTPSARQQEVASEVMRIQDFAKQQLRPGAMLRDYERNVHFEMGKALQRLGLIHNARDSQEIWRYYPHATSHFLGLDVHDVGDYDQPLAENMVLTCEPGIYIAEESLGVRIEDDLVITPTGNRLLGDDCSPRLYTI